MFLAAVELLEAIDYHISAFTSNGWEWIFLDNVPWLAIAIVLVQIPQVTAEPEIVRAKRQIEIVFRRYEDPDRSLSGSRMWKILVDLRQQSQRSWISGSTTDVSARSADLRSEHPVSVATTTINENFLMDYAVPFGQSDLCMYDESFDLPDLNGITWYY